MSLYDDMYAALPQHERRSIEEQGEGSAHYRDEFERSFRAAMEAQLEVERQGGLTRAKQRLTIGNKATPRGPVDVVQCRVCRRRLPAQKRTGRRAEYCDEICKDFANALGVLNRLGGLVALRHVASGSEVGGPGALILAAARSTGQRGREQAAAQLALGRAKRK